MQFLYHDLIVRGAICNLRCSYCISTRDAKNYESRVLPIAKPKPGRDRNQIDIEQTLRVVDMVADHTPAPLLKVSGGEMFLFRNVLSLIEKLSERYTYVQLLTNGTTLRESDVRCIAKLGNVGLNLSLDGHTLSMNHHRWRSPGVMDAALYSLRCILDMLGEVEITSVISEVNASRYADFLDFLSQLDGRPVAIPIPVRVVDDGSFFPVEERLRFAAMLRRIYQPFRNVLGPAAYYLRLARFLDEEQGIRQHRCNVANLAIQAFDSGTLTPCPVGWTVSLGNLIDDSADAVLEQIGKHKMYDMLTRRRPRVPVCRSCFAPSDIINLFLAGEIGIDEMARIPMYRPRPIQTRLIELKERFAPQHASS